MLIDGNTFSNFNEAMVDHRIPTWQVLSKQNYLRITIGNRSLRLLRLRGIYTGTVIYIKSSANMFSPLAFPLLTLEPCEIIRYANSRKHESETIFRIKKMFNLLTVHWILWGNDLYNEQFTQASLHFESVFKKRRSFAAVCVCVRVVKDGKNFRFFPLSSKGWWLGWFVSGAFSVLTHHTCMLAQLMVKTAQRSSCLISLQMRTERVATLGFSLRRWWSQTACMWITLTDTNSLRAGGIYGDEVSFI